MLQRGPRAFGCSHATVPASKVPASAAPPSKTAKPTDSNSSMVHVRPTARVNQMGQLPQSPHTHAPRLVACGLLDPIFFFFLLSISRGIGACFPNALVGDTSNPANSGPVPRYDTRLYGATHACELQCLTTSTTH